MSDPFAKTIYRVAQHWRFKSQTPEASEILIIIGVEDHPGQGIICNVSYEYDPPFRISQTGSMSGGNLWVTEAALDRSVLELVTEKGTLPSGYGTTGEFRCGPEFWKNKQIPWAVDRTIGELIHEQTEKHKQERDTLLEQPPYQRPPAEALGLWSLIAYDEAKRFRELLQQHPEFVNEPLPRDKTDKYCYTGEEYIECYPMMLAAELGSVGVAKVLLELGADPKQKNKSGDTALHFTGRASSGFEDVAEIAHLLCEGGADPEARNNNNKTPLTISCCSNEVAKVLIQFGASPTLNHAIRLRMLDWVRRELQNNPNALRETVFPNSILEDIGFLIQDEAELKHGRELRILNGDTPSDQDDGWPDRQAYMQASGYRTMDDGSYCIDGKLTLWQRHAEIEKQVFDEYLDLLDTVKSQGADPNACSALWYATQMLDTSLAEWLLAHGADPNRDVKKGIANYLPDQARTRRMEKLLRSYGAEENPYSNETDEWDKRMKQAIDRLKEQFD